MLKFLGTAKALLRGKFIGINSCTKKEERYQINNLACLETLLAEQT